MKKTVYKRTKVVYNAHYKCYEVWYKNWFRWHIDCDYRWDEDGRHIHYSTKEQAEQKAIARAKAMLENVIVFEGAALV